MTRGRRLSLAVVVPALACSLAPAAFFVAPSGCASHSASTQPTSRPLTARERQERAMRDPFNYSPDAGKTDISGGGLTDFDRDAFNRDLRNALDP